MLYWIERLIQDKSSNEELKESIAKQQIKSMDLENQKKKPSKLNQAGNVGKGLVRAIEKM